MPIIARKDFYFSETAIKNNIDNHPKGENAMTIVNNLQYTQECFNNIAYEVFIKPHGVKEEDFGINSMFRCTKLNNLLKGSKTSQHPKGEALDFTIKNWTPKQICQEIGKSIWEYDQLILETHCVHISFIVNALLCRNEFRIQKNINGKKRYPLFDIDKL